ncbi:MAG: hypothetical protein LUG13_07265 [Oscillospiraceae bacterium]|nr:hypothetical protein [Oscillospiraceae bacterium]
MAIAVAIIYFAVIIIISIFLSRRGAGNAKAFTSANGGLGWLLVTFSFVLMPLGSGHTLSLWETATSSIGASAVWWGVGAGGIFLPIMMLWLGPWVRESRLGTMPEIFEKMFGRGYGSLQAGFQTASWTGIGIAETIGTGTAIYGLTGGNLSLRYCVVIAIILMLLYVLFGGILQLAFLNVINALVLLVGSYVSLGFIGTYLAANYFGWAGIQEIYAGAGGAWEALKDVLLPLREQLGLVDLSPTLITNFNLSNSDVWFNVIIPVVVLHVTAAGVSQAMNTPFFAAKDNHACRKGVFLGSSLNVMTCVPWVVLALVGMVMPTVLAAGDADIGKTVVPLLAIEAMPAPMLGLLMISLMAATLSTGGSILMGNGMVIANDVIKRPWAPNMSDKHYLIVLRICICVMAAMMLIGALNMAVLFPVFIWCFSFGIPLFVLYLCGQIWKISVPAAWITTVVAYAFNIYWTFWTPAWVTGPMALNMYPVCIISLVLGVGLTALLPGTPGLRTKKYAALHPEVVIERT